ncbi:34342_t:CDS:2, partial [Racocetra persica]
ISGLLEEIKKSLLQGENIRFPGYFSMHTVMSKAREAMNLQTGKKIKVPAKMTPKAKFSLDLKKEIAAAIETSCDETSVAILEKKKVLSNITISQILEQQKYGG